MKLFDEEATLFKCSAIISLFICQGKTTLLNYLLFAPHKIHDSMVVESSQHIFVNLYYTVK